MARSFNGTSDLISANNPVDTTTAFSISCWINPNSSQNNATSYFLGIGKASSDGMQASVDLTTLQLRINVGNVQNIQWGFNLTAATWANVVATYDGNAATRNLIGYVNAVQKLNTTVSGPTHAATGHFNLGDWDTGTEFYHGLISDVAVWSVVLTQGEITALSLGCRPWLIRPASIVAYWPLYGLASPEPEFGGTANNGSLTGTVAANDPPLTLWTTKAPSAEVLITSSFLAAWALQRNVVHGGVAT